MLAAVRFKDSMRWRGDTAFSRPLRSLLALHGGAVLPFAFAGLRAGRTTHGLRSETAAPIEVSRLNLCSDSKYTCLPQPHVKFGLSEYTAGVLMHFCYCNCRWQTQLGMWTRFGNSASRWTWPSAPVPSGTL